MTTDDRFLKAESFTRRTASPELTREAASWDVWDYAEPEYRHEYTTDVTLIVNSGGAVLTFGNGEKVDLIPGDSLQITQGTKAHWVFTVPISNSYCYHEPR